MTIDIDTRNGEMLMSEAEATAVLATMQTCEDPRPRETLIELLMTTGTTAMQVACPEAAEEHENLRTVDL